MGYYTTAEIVKIVNKLIDRCGTRDPYKVAKELGINVIYRNFDKQRGAYKVILKNRFVFLKNGMHPVVEQIVLWHEIGHDVLHRQEAVAVGGFKEFNIFDMRENRMEYEANIFASQASLPDDTILEYIENGYDIQQIARAMCSDINLIALKVDTLIAQTVLTDLEYAFENCFYSVGILRFRFGCLKRELYKFYISLLA